MFPQSHAEKLTDTDLRKFLDPIQYAAVDISPSGKYVSLIRRDDEINTLIVLDMATMKPTASVKYGEKGKTKKLNVCCTRWINDELLSYGTTTKTRHVRGRGRQGNIHLLSADGSRNDQIWTPYGNYENNSAKRGRLFSKALPAMESVLEDDDDHIMLFFLSWEPTVQV